MMPYVTILGSETFFMWVRNKNISIFEYLSESIFIQWTFLIDLSYITITIFVQFWTENCFDFRNNPRSDLICSYLLREVNALWVLPVYLDFEDEKSNGSDEKSVKQKVAEKRPQYYYECYKHRWKTIVTF